jgi:bifunctional non-homologous end joining protein LigD
MSDQHRPPRATLSRYRERRDASRTNEPFGVEGDTPAETEGGTRSGAFVVHLHRARRLHYDLRLEMGGALLSFALPKGPTLDPAEKHLAIRTEEHPLEYVDFEDVIPEGNYGAGPMIVWDRGAVRYPEQSAEDGLAAGKLDFVLSGFKLKGRFALVKIEDEEGASDATWLLLKKSDAHARSGGSITAEEPRSVLSGLTVDELAAARDASAEIERRAAALGAPEGSLDGRTVCPMPCSTLDEPPRGNDWICELKLDGVRVVADKQEEAIALTYRSRRDATAAYPEIVRALAALPVRRVVLDGVIVAFDDAGAPSFQRLSQRIHLAERWNIVRASLRVPVAYLVFDVLAVGGRVTTSLPLEARRELVRAIVPHAAGFVRALDFLDGHATELLDFCRARKLEGIVVKRKGAPYRQGPRRTSDWIKIKCERDESFVVLGYTRGEGSRSRLGALDLGSYDADGHLVVRGKVGSGLDEKSIAALLAKLEPIATKERRFEGKLGSAPGGRTLVEPRVVVSVRYLGWSDDGLLRFPVFRGIDPDRAPEDCRAAPHDDRQIAAPPREASRLEQERSARTHAERTEGVEGPRRVAARSQPLMRATLTNQDKLFWPEDGITKGELLRYYEAISHVILPYLRDRPVVVVRYPDGIHGKGFFQWNVPWGFPAWMRHVPLSKDGEDKKKRVFLVNDVESLLTVVNLGCIPLHVLARRELSLDQCDFATIDLDVERSTFEVGVRLATALGELLERIGLPGYAKTSGQTGLHVLVPLGPGVGFDTAATLAMLLGRLLVARFPDEATMERDIEKRGSRVYVDVFQTHPRKTIVAPYSVRAVPGATVSTPVAWAEVGPSLDPRSFTLRTVPERVRKLGDPMRPMLDAKPDVAAAVGRLGELVR